MPSRWVAPTMLAVALVLLPRYADATIPFAFQLESFEVDGNIFGPADGTPDFSDSFTGGSLSPAWVVSSGNVVTSAGVANLVSPGGLGTALGSTFEFSEADLTTPVQLSSGDFDATARFSQTTLQPGRFTVLNLGFASGEMACGVSRSVFGVGYSAGLVDVQSGFINAVSFAESQITGDIVCNIHVSASVAAVKVSIDGGATFIYSGSTHVYDLGSTMTVGFAAGAQVPVDSDGDGIPNDGDNSGIASDNPCVGGNTVNCDDNCPANANPTQADADSDGAGDACDYNCQSATGGTISGTAYAGTVAPASVVPGARVFVCAALPSVCCQEAHADVNGDFVFNGLNPGTYSITAYPPYGSGMLNAYGGPFAVTATEVFSGQDLVLELPAPPPPEVTLDATVGYTTGGVPRVWYEDTIPVAVTGCPGATAEYTFILGMSIASTGPMVEGPAGTYSAVIPAPYPRSGAGGLTFTLHCSGGDVQHHCPIWIDPSGTVRFSTGDVAPGARVTLLRSDTPGGPFEVVPFGSEIMSPSNRVNPDTSRIDGKYGWDVVPGFYLVRAELGDGTTTSAVLTIPPAVTDLTLDIGLPCNPTAAATGQRLTASRLLSPSGDENLAIKGQAVVPGNHDPVAEGARLLLTGASGNILLDVTVPPGAYDIGTKTGWKVNTTATAWTFKGPGTTTQGIQSFSVKRRPNVADELKFAVKGKRTNLTIQFPDAPVTARLILDVPTAADGRCAAVRFPAAYPTRPSCTLGDGATLKCK